MSNAGSTKDSSSLEQFVDDGNSLFLYHFYTSYYSQKVVFALYEKNLKFKSQVVNLLEGEQYEPWFLRLNPRGEVPVLKDGVKIIPDSSRILDYLEDNFSNGDTPRLKPEKGSTQYQKMERFINILDKVRIQCITFGSLLHPELCEKVKMSPKETKAQTGKLMQHQLLLENMMEKHKEFSGFYLSKREALKKNYMDFQDVDYVKNALNELGTVLDEIEKELGSHSSEEQSYWLCGEKFTIADIILAVLLNRLQYIGQWNRYFGKSSRPNLSSYFKRVQGRDAFHKTVNQSLGILGTLCCLETKEKIFVSFASAVIILGVAGLAAFLMQRKK